MNAVVEYIKKTLAPCVLSNSSSVQQQSSDDDTELSMYELALREQLKKRKPEGDLPSDPVTREVTQFFDNNLCWDSVLIKQGVHSSFVEAVGTGDGTWVANWELLSKHFDCMRWWEEIGKQQFPLIYLVAATVLPLPESNGNQERTFSAATWMDTKLSKKQTDATFQMTTLIYKNGAFLDQARSDAGAYQVGSYLPTEVL